MQLNCMRIQLHHIKSDLRDQIRQIIVLINYTRMTDCRTVRINTLYFCLCGLLRFLPVHCACARDRFRFVCQANAPLTPSEAILWIYKQLEGRPGIEVELHEAPIIE